MSAQQTFVAPQPKVAEKKCCPVVAATYAEIGKGAKELLSGSGKGGAFSYEPKLAFTSKTAHGVTFAVSAVHKGTKIDPTLKVAYAVKKYSGDASFAPDGKITVGCNFSDVAPGLKLNGAVTLPDPSSARLGLDYVLPYVAVKASVGLTSAPLVDLSAASGYKSLIFGAEGAYDTAKSCVSKYNVAVGYQKPDYQVAAFLTDKATVARLVYSHNVTSTQTVGAEIIRRLATSDTTFAIGYSKKLADGALSKLKLDNAGALSAMYETKLATGEKVAGSLQVQVTDLSKPVKYGFALDLF